MAASTRNARQGAGASAKPKATTKRIVLSEPDEELLKEGIEGRVLSPDLVTFLTQIVRAHKWTRKINIPSTRDDLAAVIVFTSALKERGIELFSELHVFFAGRTIVERWQVAGEREQKSALSNQAFAAADIQKVRVQNKIVYVEIGLEVSEGKPERVIKTFDFAAEMTPVRVVPHPFCDIRPE